VRADGGRAAARQGSTGGRGVRVSGGRATRIVEAGVRSRLRAGGERLWEAGGVSQI
jgi:hypothetical protein